MIQLSENKLAFRYESLQSYLIFSSWVSHHAKNKENYSNLEIVVLKNICKASFVTDIGVNARKYWEEHINHIFISCLKLFLVFQLITML